MGDEGSRASVDSAPALRAQRGSREVMDIASALGTRMTPAWNPEEPVSLSTFVKLKEAFDAADADGGGDLDVDEFVRAFSDLMPGADDAHLRRSSPRLTSTPTSASTGTSSPPTSSSPTRPRRRCAKPPPARTTSPPRATSTSSSTTRSDTRTSSRASFASPRRISTRASPAHGTIRAWEHLDEDPPAIAMHKRVNCGSAYLTDAALLPATSRLAVASFNRRVRVYETKGWTEAGSYRSFGFRAAVLRGVGGRERHRRTLQGRGPSRRGRRRGVSSRADGDRHDGRGEGGGPGRVRQV